ncbi:MAG: replication-associated recombination protein A [Rhodobacteraceae bacterium]|nr:replication-associated recombination protein A [Paracoccaceae bacterium]
MTDLFDTGAAAPDNAPRPLADRLRPQKLLDVIGQDHIIGPDAPLGQMLLHGNLSSLIFWGPPGVGKTTIARLLADEVDLAFVQISAIFSGIADLRKVFEAAKLRRQNGKGTLLFVDEIHRFNKAQQDAFLPYVEDGTLILIGATTENPSFSLNSALLSRLNILTLKSLTDEELLKIIARYESIKSPLPIEAEEKKKLTFMCQGDARYLLNLLENLEKMGSYDQKTIEALLSKKRALYDRQGEYHYNLISSLHKSIRGSDPDTALYWFARMLEGGEDPLYLGRRLMRIAAEDIGLADPEALKLAIAAIHSFEKVGLPEGELFLAEVVVYLALAPKSNSLYVAYGKAKELASKTGNLPPPMHITNAPNKVMAKMGYGKGYIYDHDTKESFSGQNYFPPELPRKKFYHPIERGFERDLKKRIEYFTKLREQKELK